MDDKFEILYFVQAPTRLSDDKTEKAIQLLRNGDLNSLLKCKELIIELINKNR